MSVCIASPGPFTTQPRIDILIGSLTQENLLSICFTVFITSNCCLAQEGQEIIFRPVFLIFKAFNISIQTLISLTGSSESDTLKVSPIPSESKIPNPIEDFTVPENSPPASVTPKCKG